MKYTRQTILIIMLISTVVLLQLLNFINYLIVWNVPTIFGYEAFISFMRVSRVIGPIIGGGLLGIVLMLLTPVYHDEGALRQALYYGIAGLILGYLISPLANYIYYWLMLNRGSGDSMLIVSFVNYLWASLFRVGTPILFLAVALSASIFYKLNVDKHRAKAKNKRYVDADNL